MTYPRFKALLFTAPFFYTPEASAFEDQEYLKDRTIPSLSNNSSIKLTDESDYQDILDWDLWAPYQNIGSDPINPNDYEVHPTQHIPMQKVTIVDVLKMTDDQADTFNNYQNILFRLADTDRVMRVIDYLTYSKNMREEKIELLFMFEDYAHQAMRRFLRNKTPSDFMTRARFYSQLTAECIARPCLLGHKSSRFYNLDDLPKLKQAIEKENLSIIQNWPELYKAFCEHLEFYHCKRHKWDKSWTTTVIY